MASKHLIESGVVSIVGSGFIGRSWAILYARTGFTVRLFDVSEEQLKSAETAILHQLKTMQEDDLLNGQQKEDIYKRFSFHEDLGEALKDAVYVQASLPVVWYDL